MAVPKLTSVFCWGAVAVKMASRGVEAAGGGDLGPAPAIGNAGHSAARTGVRAAPGPKALVPLTGSCAYAARCAPGPL